jgi:hypothetical protein
MKRLLIEIAIIAAVIWFGWNKPFGERVGQTTGRVNAGLDELGGDLQKNQDSSVKRYQSGR